MNKFTCAAILAVPSAGCAMLSYTAADLPIVVDMHEGAPLTDLRKADIEHVDMTSGFDGSGITGWKDAGETRNVTAALRTRGLSDADMVTILGGNLLRVSGRGEAQCVEGVSQDRPLPRSLAPVSRLLRCKDQCCRWMEPGPRSDLAGRMVPLL